MAAEAASGLCLAADAGVVAVEVVSVGVGDVPAHAEATVRDIAAVQVRRRRRDADGRIRGGNTFHQDPVGAGGCGGPSFDKQAKPRTGCGRCPPRVVEVVLAALERDAGDETEDLALAQKPPIRR